MSDHFTGIPSLDGTFSRLVPVLRSLCFQSRAQIPNWVRTDPHFSTDNATRISEEHPDTDLCQEMSDIVSSYLSRIRRDGLSRSRREFYGSIVDMAREVIENPKTSAEIAARVRNYDKNLRDTVTEFSVVDQGLAVLERDARLYRFHCHLGDFSSCVCDLLKNGVLKGPLKAPWPTIVKTLDEEEKTVNAWKASNSQAQEPRSPFKEVIVERVRLLNELGHTDVDTDIALFAVRTYARRCLVVHNCTFGLHKAGKGAELASYLDLVDKTLESALPDDEVHLVKMYRRLLAIYKNRKIKKLDDGSWVPIEDERPLQRPQASAARSVKDDKSPADKLIDQLRQCQDEFGKLDANTREEKQWEFEIELDKLKTVIQGRVEKAGRGAKGKGKGRR